MPPRRFDEIITRYAVLFPRIYSLTFLCITYGVSQASSPLLARGLLVLIHSLFNIPRLSDSSSK